MFFKKSTKKPAEEVTRISSQMMINSTPETVNRRPSITIATSQSVGKQREHNEDAILALLIHEGIQDDFSSAGIFIIADGMGGHLHGEIASKLAITRMTTFVMENHFIPNLSVKFKVDQPSIQETMKSGVLSAHEAILSDAPGGGTTMTAVLLSGGFITIAHVGDSRAYMFENGSQPKILTRDHSFVKRLVELGQITEDEAALHPQRNVLYRALGQGEPFEPDIISLPIPNDGIMAICSDGLWGVLPELELIKYIQSDQPLQTICDKLVTKTNEAGGPDNISLLLVKFSNQMRE